MQQRYPAWVDHLALFVAQPVIAGLAVIGLVADPATTRAVTKPFYIWGGLALLSLIFAEGIWSFAKRHNSRQRLPVLWGKLICAGLCAILAFASAYKHLGLMDAGVMTHDTDTALYFSIATWTTASLGDVSATAQARPFVAAQSLIGFVFNSALIGLILYATTTTVGRGNAAK